MACYTLTCLCDTLNGCMECMYMCVCVSVYVRGRARVRVCMYLSVHVKHLGSQWTDFREIRNSLKINSSPITI